MLIGPVTTVLGDPFGLARRTLNASRTIELFVHPQVVPLPSLDAGLVRDLEGRPTNDPSVSDLDFHTLREYVPGDDRRHIHWQSSARMSTAAGTTTLMMKGYTDTRRSHLGVLFDAREGAYGDDDDFETAVTAAASVAVRALRDDIDVTVVAGAHAVDRAGVARTSTASPGSSPTPPTCRRSRRGSSVWRRARASPSSSPVSTRPSRRSSGRPTTSDRSCACTSSGWRRVSGAPPRRRWASPSSPSAALSDLSRLVRVVGAA